MRSAGLWALGLGVSVLVHLGAAAGLMAALRPDTVPDQPMPASRLNVDSQQVTREAAEERPPEADAAVAGETTGAALGLGAITETAAPERAATGQTLLQAASRVEPLPDRTQAGTEVAVAQAALAPAVAAATRPKATAVQNRSASGAAISPAAPPAATVDTVQPQLAALPSAPVPLAPAAETPPDVTDAAPRAPESLPMSEAQPQVTTAKASLAFPATGPVDPVSLAAFQSFTDPAKADTADLRDALSSALDVPCARMQVIFDPETTTLRLTGHVPDEGNRAPVLAALQAQMGSDIAVADNLLVLPAPQCGALSGIAKVGLPQSTDQITNPMIVGQDTHARAFRYETGDPLVLDLTGPDYAAYVYVDYFDAAGNVIHLAPNDQTPLQFTQPKAPLQIGARGPDETGLFVRIGPPYGQEIAAAFASSVPLYDGLRPLVEPADAYLEWLKARVAEARAADPTFKGEWVYFFVTTAEK